jgi:hypothetical protein
MDAEVAKLAKRVEPVDALQRDVPEPHALEPWQLVKKVQVRLAEAQSGGAADATDGPPPCLRDALGEPRALEIQRRSIVEVVRDEELSLALNRHPYPRSMSPSRSNAEVQLRALS